MHIRIRCSKENPSEQIVFLVQENNREVANLALQKGWDAEQKAQREEFDLSDNPPTSVHIQRYPCIEKPEDFIVEFMDLGQKYILSTTKGVVQWFLKEIPTNQLYQKNVSSITAKNYHKFFSEELISLDRNTVDNLAALLAASGTDWVCDNELNHSHLIVKIYLELNMDMQNFESFNAKHVMHVVCGDTKLVDLFREICGDKLKDQFSLTQVYYTDSEKNLVLGTSYTYLTAMARKILVKDLGWEVSDHRRVWLCGGERSKEVLLKEVLTWDKNAS